MPRTIDWEIPSELQPKGADFAFDLDEKLNGILGLQATVRLRMHDSPPAVTIVIVIMNNGGYGIIKQFQDSYLGSRYEASRDGYSVPDFRR